MVRRIELRGTLGIMQPPMPSGHRRALDDFARRLRGRFGTRLRHVRLFGSWARGTASADSDLDVAVVIDDLDRVEWHAAIDDAADVELAHDVVLGPYVVSTSHFDELTRRGRELANAIARDGVAL